MCVELLVCNIQVVRVACVCYFLFLCVERNERHLTLVRFCVFIALDISKNSIWVTLLGTLHPGVTKVMSKAYDR